MASDSVTYLYGEKGDSLYASRMVKRVLMGVGDFRQYLRGRMQAGKAGEHTLVSARGNPDSVLVPIEWYRRAAESLGELDDGGDIKFSLFEAPVREQRRA